MKNRSASNVCSLYEGHFHYGLAGLINSLVANSFSGRVFVGYRGELPFWFKGKLFKEIDGEEIFYMPLDDVELFFIKLKTDYHLTNYKPIFMIDLFEKYSFECENLFYFDPDIVIKCRWSFFEDWIRDGVAVVQEIINNTMSRNHPVRNKWKRFFEKNNFEIKRDLNFYINGGFVGLRRENIEFLYIWKSIMDAGYRDDKVELHPTQFKHSLDRTFEFSKQDQDGLNMSAMCCESSISDYGPEGMDFIPGGKVMSHATGSPKPWKANYINLMFNGRKVPFSSIYYWENIGKGPINVFSNSLISRKKRSILINKIFTRFYSK